MDKLTKYNKKRDFNKTKEPSGKKKKSTKKLHFVVQHHLARKDHYDLRLEWNGTLKSWAVPKGPSYDPNEKRLAVQVEDHPLDYRKFEGTIPKGEYGGGTVMIWDEGTWEYLDDTKPDFKKKGLKFSLHGKRLKGKWFLMPYKEDNWLLIKEHDKYNEFDNISEFFTSIKTGRTMDEIENHQRKDPNVIESIEITNPDKIIFPKEKITKKEIVEYYQTVSDRMMPYLKNRLISVIRAPEGNDGDKFFKKHLENKNKGLGKVRIPSSKNQKEDYYYIKNIYGLISEVQMNSFEFHIWGSPAKNINKPNMMVFDLDPDEGMNISSVRQGVKDLKSILDELNLASYLKTSGGKGYHVVVPIKDNITWKTFRKISKNIAELMESKWPDKYISNMRKNKRKNKIYIDWVRNTKGATSVAPYSIRLKDKASVSCPISWNELDKINPNEIGMKEAIKRLKRKDPWIDFFD